jgi:hypothetical protein
MRSAAGEMRKPVKRQIGAGQGRMSEDKRSGGNHALARTGTRDPKVCNRFCNWAVSEKGKDPTQRRDGRLMRISQPPRFTAPLNVSIL